MNEKSENALSRNENAALDKSSALFADVIATTLSTKAKKKKKKKSRKHFKRYKKSKDSRNYDLYVDDYYSYKNEFHSLVRTGDAAPIEMRVFPDSDIGIYIGKHGSFSYAILSTDEGNAFIIGGTGSGKSDCIVKNTIIKRSKPAFITDYKGELITLKTNRPKKILYFTDEEGEDSFHFDPFDFIKAGSDRNVVSNARALAEAIIPLPVKTDKSFWIMAERDVLTAAIIFYYDLKVTFVDTMIAIKNLTTRQLVGDILRSNNERAKMCITPCLADENSGAEMLSGVELEISNHISIFAGEEIIQRVLKPSEKMLKLSDLNTHNVFLRIPLEKAGQWGAVIRLITTQQILKLMQRPDKYSDEGVLFSNVLLLLDEFPRIGKLEIIIEALETLRSKNVTVALLCQSIADLDNIYGAIQRRIIIDNCEFTAILKAKDPETQRFLSDMVGTAEVAVRGMSENYNIESGDTSYSRQVSEGRKRVIEPHEFRTLKDIILLSPYNQYSRLEKDFYHLLNGKLQERNNPRKPFALPNGYWDKK
jgi:type IV secretion system protein VirD4